MGVGGVSCRETAWSAGCRGITGEGQTWSSLRPGTSSQSLQGKAKVGESSSGTSCVRTKLLQSCFQWFQNIQWKSLKYKISITWV